MPRGLRYIFVSAVVILLIILGILLLTRNRGPGQGPVNTPKAVKLSDLATEPGSNVQYIVEGPINAPENHRTMQILISADSRVINIFKGYEGEILSTQTLPNDGKSYNDFLEALNRANFTRTVKATFASSVAICPTAQRAHYLAVKGTETLQDTWAASCATGTFGGNKSLTATLFRSQIPNFTQIKDTVNLSTASGSTIL